MTVHIVRFQGDRSDAAFLEIGRLPAVAEHEWIAVLQQIDHRVVIVDRDGDVYKRQGQSCGVFHIDKQTASASAAGGRLDIGRES